MADNKFNDVVQSMIKGMDGFLSSKTVVGEPTVIGDVTVIPFVDVSFGMGAGNLNNDKKDSGAGGLSGKMTPSSVLIISKGTTKLVNIKNQDNVGKILDMIPDIVNKVAEKKNITMTNEEATKIAFPETEEE